MINFFKNKDLEVEIQKEDEFFQPEKVAYFWRRMVALFFCSLVCLLIAYLFVLRSIVSIENNKITSTGDNDASSVQVIDQKALNIAITEIKKRQQNFAQLSSSTPNLIDPSL